LETVTKEKFMATRPRRLSKMFIAAITSPAMAMAILAALLLVVVLQQDGNQPATIEQQLMTNGYSQTGADDQESDGRTISVTMWTKTVISNTYVTVTIKDGKIDTIADGSSPNWCTPPAGHDIQRTLDETPKILDVASATWPTYTQNNDFSTFDAVTIKVNDQDVTYRCYHRTK
jgi:hypothetical protein